MAIDLVELAYVVLMYPPLFTLGMLQGLFAVLKVRTWDKVFPPPAPEIWHMSVKMQKLHGRAPSPPPSPTRTNKHKTGSARGDASPPKARPVTNLQLNFEGHETGLNVKKAIYQRTGIPVHAVELYYNPGGGADKYLRDYDPVTNVPRGSVHCHMRMRGGRSLEQMKENLYERAARPHHRRRHRPAHQGRRAGRPRHRVHPQAL